MPPCAKGMGCRREGDYIATVQDGSRGKVLESGLMAKAGVAALK